MNFEATPLDLLIGLIVGLMLGVIVAGGILAAFSGGPGRLMEVLQLGRRLRSDPALAERIAQLLKVSGATGPDRSQAAAMQLLAMLQEQARLVDFLLEDISNASDAQIGQAVREIHRQARQVLQEHLTFEPILTAKEGENVTIPAGYDPSAIRVLGHVTGTPPYVGQVEHPGWRAREIKLPEQLPGADPRVIQPAIVQIPEQTTQS